MTTSKISLRAVLVVSFLLLSIIPVATVTFYSWYKYGKAMKQEQKERLEANRREVQMLLGELESGLNEKIKEHSVDNLLIYYMAQRSTNQIFPLMKKWLETHFAHRITVFDRQGQLMLSVFKDPEGIVKQNQRKGKAPVFLSKSFLENLDSRDNFSQIEINKNESLNILAFSKVRTSSGKLVGYVEEIVELDKNFLKSLKERMNLELLFLADPQSQSFPEGEWPIVSSHEEFEVHDNSFFREKILGQEFFEFNIGSQAFSFLVRPVDWQGQQFYMAVGVSKQAMQTIMDEVSNVIIGVVVMMILLLILLSVVISKVLLKPLSDLIEVIQQTKPGEEISQVGEDGGGELGQLARSFNEMSRRVNATQKALKTKVKELETANNEISNTQTRLIHSAKMASLGQLVAGVAHELNNPIGFIYSNMTHLQEHSETLIKLVEIAEKQPNNLSQKKKELEFEYILEDMPKLIKSCEDGAKRTRDIVLGLRNFSRLEEAKVAEVNLEEELENTLKLLSGELKNRIEVKKNFSQIPKIKGYPSQLNQVFMNILSNAAQAIEGEGSIFITTKLQNDKTIQIVIGDTGSGMDTETLHKIFDPFFSTKTLGKGTGLGLSISYGILQKHGGDIQVKSKKGEGTEFTILLPIAGPSESV